MVALLLLAAALLLPDLSPGTASDINPVLYINSINLFMEPSFDVTHGTNVTLRCRAVIKYPRPLSREYTIYKSGSTVYRKTISTSEDLLHTLHDVQFSNMGRYTCKVKVQDLEDTSKATRMVVRGVTPELHLDKVAVTEGEELTARCTAPGETGSFAFYFYDDDERIRSEWLDTNQAEVKLSFDSLGDRRIHCSYSISGSQSNESNTVNVLVRDLKIASINLSMEPSADVTRGTNVTLRCRAVIEDQEDLSREYTIYKGGSTIYTKTTSQDLVYTLNDVQFSGAGEYTCKVKVQNKQKTSRGASLLVRRARPELRLDKHVFTEGGELTARCTAPRETGSFAFYFYDDSEELMGVDLNTNQAEVKLTFHTAGNHTIHCWYSISGIRSGKSNAVSVLVSETARPELKIHPEHEVYEGDRLHFLCTILHFQQTREDFDLVLRQGTRELAQGLNKISHSMITTAEDSGEFQCLLIKKKGVKYAIKAVPVRELFSVPTLVVYPTEVFQKDLMTLTCKSATFASERIRKGDLTYSLDPEVPTSNQDTGVFQGKAPVHDFNYTCVAAANGIRKKSPPLPIHPKVHASTPRISVEGHAVLGRPVKILCQSDFGSLPINYMLLKDYGEVDNITVRLPSQKAVFTVQISSSEEMSKLLCDAQNSNRLNPPSKKLNATLIMPLSHPTLTVIPVQSEISEGDDVYLICGVKGSPPVTFKWYLVGQGQPLYCNTSARNTSTFVIRDTTADNSGTYICEASNFANNIVRTAGITVNVRMALWKKALFGFLAVLLLSVLVVVGALCFKYKRGQKETAAELSVKPPSPYSDDTLAVNLTLVSDARNAAPANKAVVSVWSERLSGEASGEEGSVMTNEPDVEYTEVVHPHHADPARVPLRRGTDTVYSELQNSPHGAVDPRGNGSMAYAELQRDDPEPEHFHRDVYPLQDLPVPAE